MTVKKGIFHDLIMVLVSNILILLSSILTGLVVPKIMGVNNYSYYKIFTLYTSYTALFHFGFIDGILLKHGADDYDRLDKEQFRTNSQFFIAFQIVIATIIGVSSILFKDSDYKFIFLALSIFMVLSNITSYYQFISQATLRFKELSLRKLIQSGLTVVVVLTVLVYKHTVEKFILSYRLYIVLTLCITVVLSIWYVYTYRDITFGKRRSIVKQRMTLLSYFKKGIYLTIAYQVSTLVFTIDSQYISLLFSKVTYGMYAFAYSLIQMVLTVLNAVSTVLFPHIKRLSIKSAMGLYPQAISYIVLVVYASMLGYYPIRLFIYFYLPEYINSLGYFEILFPGVGLTCCITLITFNYFKIIDKNRLYFFISVGVLIWSIILNTIAYFIFKTAYSIAFASLITLFIWRFVTEFYLVRKYNVKWVKNLMYTLLMTVVFLWFVKIDNLALSFISYALAYLIISYILYKDTMKNMIKMLVGNKQENGAL